MLIIWTDRLFVGHFLNISDVGVYQAASQITLLFAIILTGFNVAFSPMIVQLYHNGKLSDLNSLYQISTKWGLYLSMPIFLMLVLFPRDVLTVTFGSEYIRGSMPLVILSVAQLVNVATGAVGLILTMTGNQNKWLFVSAISFGFNVFLSILLIPRLQLIGAAIATGLTIAGLFISALVWIRLIFGFWPYDRRYLKGIFATFITAIVLIPIRLLQIEPAIFRVSLAFLFSLTAFFAGLWLMGFDREDVGFFSMISRRLNPHFTDF